MPGQCVSDRPQRGANPLPRLRVPVVGGPLRGDELFALVGGQTVEDVVADQHHPVVSRGGAAVPLQETGAGRQHEQPGMVQTQGCVGEFRFLRGQLRPARLLPRVGDTLAEPAAQPGHEVGAGKTGGEQVGAEFREPQSLLGDVVLFGGCGFGDPDEFREGGEVAVADQGGNGSPADRGAEHAPNQYGLTVR